MQTDIAILFVDLSGYTSLTETHGDLAAADVIDKYVQMVNESLVGEAKIHERTGDELMIVSPTARDLLFTATALVQNTSAEDQFLQLHGGLHFGNILLRNNHYFGSTINLASRIAKEALPGSIYCSEAFINSINDCEANFECMGDYSFKNISGKTKVFKLLFPHEGTVYIDPVCRMLIRDPHNAVPHPENKELYFCSEHCLNIYLAS